MPLLHPVSERHRPLDCGVSLLKDLLRCAFNPECGLAFSIILLTVLPLMATIFGLLPDSFTPATKALAYTGCFAAFLFDRPPR